MHPAQPPHDTSPQKPDFQNRPCAECTHRNHPSNAAQKPPAPAPKNKSPQMHEQHPPAPQRNDDISDDYRGNNRATALIVKIH